MPVLESNFGIVMDPPTLVPSRDSADLETATSASDWGTRPDATFTIGVRIGSLALKKKPSMSPMPLAVRIVTVVEPNGAIVLPAGSARATWSAVAWVGVLEFGSGWPCQVTRALPAPNRRA